MKKKSLVFVISLVLIIFLAILFFKKFNISGKVVNEKENFMLDFIESNNEVPLKEFSPIFLKENKNNRPEYSGFIVEFEKEPIIKKKIELEKTARENQQILDNLPRYSYARTQKLSEVHINNLDLFVQNHIQEINSEREQVKKEISHLISDKEKKIPITGKIISFLTGKSISYSSGSEADKVIINEFENLFNGVVVNVNKETAREISKIKGVKKVWPNSKVEALIEDSVPLIQEGISAGKLDKDGNDCLSSGKECLTGKGITIAIIDTGVDYTHPDLGNCTTEEFLEGKCNKVVSGYDFVNNDNDPIDDHGHGTHCAGIATGNKTLKGVAPDAQILAYKVLDYDGYGTWENVIAAIEKSVEDNADILSLSLGKDWGDPDDPASQAVDNAVLTGSVVVVAAGNSGPSELTIGSPATSRKAITVGSTTKQNQISNFSSRGPVIWDKEVINAIIKPDIVAPGGTLTGSEFCKQGLMSENRICSTWLDKDYLAISGTSMATPHIAGAVALLKQKNPEWTPEEIKNSLKATSNDLGYPQIEQGAGLVNIPNLIALNEPLIYKEPVNWSYLYGGIYYSENSQKPLAGIPFNLTIALINLGTAKTENANYSLYYQEGFCGTYLFWDFPCDDLKLITSKDFELESVLGTEENLFWEEKLEVSFEKPNTYTFVLKYNSENGIGSEGNYLYDISLKEQGPDVSIKNNKKYYQYVVGENYNLSYIVKNIGTKKAENVNAYLYLENKENYFIDAKSIGSVEVEQEVYFNFSFTPQKKGNYFLHANISAKEDVDLSDNENSYYISSLNKGIDLGINDVYVYSTKDKNYIRGHLDNYGTISPEYPVGVSLFIHNKLINQENFYSYFSFEIPEEHKGQEIKIKISADVSNDINLSDNVFEDLFYIYKIENISLSVKNSSGDYADRFVRGYEDLIKETKNGEVDLVVSEEGIILLYTKSENYYEISEGYEAGFFKDIRNIKNNEEIFTERYEIILENNVPYYLVHGFNTSFNYLKTKGEYFIDRNELLNLKVEETDLENLLPVYCKDFDLENQKCLSEWNVANNIDYKYLWFFFYPFVIFSFECEEPIRAFGLSKSHKGILGTDEKNISSDIATNYEKWNQHGRIEFLKDVNISKIKEDNDLLDNIQITKNKISINTSSLIEFKDAPAKLIFRNINYIAPKIIRDGDDCKEYCSEIFYNKTTDTIEVNVTGFSFYEIVEGTYCGDKICQSNETPQNCPSDCSIPDSGGSQGSSGGSPSSTSTKSNSVATCVPTWSCSFGPCIDNKKREICTDSNKCGTSTGKPKERIEECLEGENNSSSSHQKKILELNLLNLSTIILGGLILILIILLLIFLLTKKRNKAKENLPQEKLDTHLNKAREFVRQARLKKYSDEEIKNMFIQKGWSKEQIKEVLKF